MPSVAVGASLPKVMAPLKSGRKSKISGCNVGMFEGKIKHDATVDSSANESCRYSYMSFVLPIPLDCTKHK